MKYRIGYMLTRGVVALFWLIPFRALYVIADGLAWLLYRMIGYRRKVMYDNLKRCFPEKTEAEISALLKTAYRNLADITLESVKGSSTPMREIRRRYVYKGYEMVNACLAEGRTVIITAPHINNWEWGVLTLADPLAGNTIGIYKPLSNPYTNRWINDNRMRGGKLILRGMRETFAAIEEFREQPSTFILMADQSPSNPKTAIWVDFFNQDTACLPGVEVISRKNDYPIFMFLPRRVRRGHYEITYSPICLSPAQTTEGTVTRMMMQAFETAVRNDPGNWLWSHKRWKITRQSAHT
jgi:Kdo2-lipid IVA lauroyltransferase/acyltransferase